MNLYSVSVFFCGRRLEKELGGGGWGRELERTEVDRQAFKERVKRGKGEKGKG
jgi:hypothetical protein